MYESAKGLVAVRVWNATDQALGFTADKSCVGLAALSYNKNIVASSEQYCSFVSVSAALSSFSIVDVLFRF